MIRMGKKTIVSLLLVLGAVASQAGQAQVSEKKLATLGPNEYIVTAESVLMGGSGAGCAVDDFFLVTQTSRSGKSQFFIYDKSGRRGPFDKMTADMLRKIAAVETLKPYYEAEFSNEGVEVNPDPNDRTKQYIEWNGKKFGPFQQVLGLYITPDKDKLYAFAIKAGKLRFIASDGRDVAAEGMPGGVITSPDGTKAVGQCVGHITPIEGMQLDMSKIDFSSMDDITLYAIDGRKFGPFPKSADFGETWFMADSGDWIFTVGRTAYFNGTALKPFNERVSKSTFWIDDAAHYAWIESDKLLFSDGASFPYPVMMKSEKKGGKTTLCWVSLKDNGDVVVYSRTL